MTDRYTKFANSKAGKGLVRKTGLPRPAHLRRYHLGDNEVPGPVYLGHTPGTARLVQPVADILDGLDATVITSGDKNPSRGWHALILDATSIETPEELRGVYDFFRPRLESLAPNGRLLVLGSLPETLDKPDAQIAQAALEGVTRSLGKEVRNGATVQLIRVADGAEDTLESTLRFFLSGRSAFVSGQVIDLRPADIPVVDFKRPLTGKTILLTGAAGGIGEKTATVLSSYGAHVLCVDIPAASEKLSHVANRVGGTAISLDLAADGAGDRLLQALPRKIDSVIHNAGITRDKTLARMSETAWDDVLDVNLAAPYRITRQLLDDGRISDGGSIVLLSSVTGLAGNRGQTNYAATKTGMIAMARYLSDELAKQNITINAVAPGVIETAMTAKMPFGTREGGRRLSSLSQGGQPVDVAETIAWLANPQSAPISGQVVRVCGQSLIGA